MLCFLCAFDASCHPYLSVHILNPLPMLRFSCASDSSFILICLCNSIILFPCFVSCVRLTPLAIRICLCTSLILFPCFVFFVHPTPLSSVSVCSHPLSSFHAYFSCASDSSFIRICLCTAKSSAASFSSWGAPHRTQASAPLSAHKPTALERTIKKAFYKLVRYPLFICY